MEWAGCNRLVLPSSELEMIAENRAWKALGAQDRIAAILRFLGTERVRLIELQGNDAMGNVTLQWVLECAAHPDEIDALIRSGVLIGRAERIVECLAKAKDIRDSEQKRRAGMTPKKRRNPRRRNSEGRFEKTARNESGKFKPSSK